ncbi:BREX-1 system adenine-specific DNA-methyltransferase PglX [Aliarcobacter cryaerophilus]|uniref:BREX-1 system adenine-specific DNA-methyltransferase PglX n=1 Tax=Aliarcobacter cryaerophilus TaxID=28198 RepID=UPI003DA58591
METTKLKRFAAHARKLLRDTVSTKLSFVLDQNSSARRENPSAVKQLEDEISKTSKDQVIEKVAYIWFNRFVALRFMDANNYTKIKVVSPEPSQFQPSILADAKMGHIDDDIVKDAKTREKIQALLSNQTPSNDPQGEAYKLLVVAACNYYNQAMPFLFEKISDYTELLMPDDLLSGDSILAYTREAMTPDVCGDVEVIGWLYQFYIAEKKDEVFEGIKKNKKVTPENIPAATQLFTPNWIVRYMVQNSLGRLWKLNNPDSKLAMEYYIEPETKESDYLKISSPKELKICDPACGSGHILVYAFDLLFAIYKEAGYSDDDDIIESILTNNLYGIEIDERASELASFALTMKAAAKSSSKRRFFKKETTPNICKLEVIKFNDDEIKSYMNAVGRDLFTSDLQETLKQFEEADNFGSLIVPKVQNIESILKLLESKDVTRDIFLQETHQRVLRILKQADYLSGKYHIVVANPPYKGKGELNKDLQDFMESRYPKSKGDLFACFIERGFELVKDSGYNTMVTMQAWLFIDTYKDLRAEVLDNHSIVNLIQIGFNSFPELNSKFALAAAFVLHKNQKGKVGCFMTLNNAPKNADKQKVFFEQKEAKNIFEVNSESFKDIEGTPISFEASENLREVFRDSEQLRDIAEPRQGMATGSNETFVRSWHEVSFDNIGLNCNTRDESVLTGKKWFPYNKGGGFRKWYGNQLFVVDWENDGEKIQNFTDEKGKLRSRPQNKEHYFKESITWSLIGLTFGPRYTPIGSLFDVGGSSAFPPKDKMNYIMAFMASKISSACLVSLNPTLNYQVGDIQRLPIKFPNNELKQQIDLLSLQNIEISKEDWDRQEFSWDFKKDELIKFNSKSIEDATNEYIKHWKENFNNLHSNEEKLNELFIDIYRLKNDLDSTVDKKQITILDGVIDVDKDIHFNISEIIKAYISYAAGVMFGRYSLDHDGLHIANQNESIEEVNAKFSITNPTFEADSDNVIPILDGEWFIDDISERFFQFVKVTFGNDSYESNLDFIANALSDKNKNSVETIRKYFLKDFYNDHVKRYKKRPIYWLFSSPKGSFQALIYMHRYKGDTVSVILNDYLREFITKLEATKENLEAVSIKSDATGSEKTKALKEIENIKKMIKELKEYEKDVLYPLATEKIEIDLDDGVKVNYPKFGSALKKIIGLDSGE